MALFRHSLWYKRVTTTKQSVLGSRPGCPTIYISVAQSGYEPNPYKIQALARYTVVQIHSEIPINCLTWFYTVLDSFFCLLIIRCQCGLDIPKYIRRVEHRNDKPLTSLTACNIAHRMR
jgi:hypothetical protein